MVVVKTEVDAGWEWAHAVVLLPSIDSAALREWLAEPSDGPPWCGFVIPAGWCPPELLRAAYREVCVPRREYAAFLAALTHARTRVEQR